MKAFLGGVSWNDVNSTVKDIVCREKPCARMSNADAMEYFEPSGTPYILTRVDMHCVAVSTTTYFLAVDTLSVPIVSLTSWLATDTLISTVYESKWLRPATEKAALSVTHLGGARNRDGRAIMNHRVRRVIFDARMTHEHWQC
ncbi:Aste57867_18225 [Aphanomyces stellatus]|uniref:Aste57867_18225 protein n=1 Tax=Aphanomyces stellatus TaxID=120398 RepID=A0A485L9W3_9STRA|nr:hypothetical protein As57867_018163 [Aphanomyces stellatus]VFT94963.1 Aste57867_18225 [Aphanomyces stellatus]